MRSGESPVRSEYLKGYRHESQLLLYLILGAGRDFKAVVIDMKLNQLAHIVKHCLRAPFRPAQGIVLPVLIVFGFSQPVVAATDFQLNFNAVLPATTLGPCGGPSNSTSGDCTIFGGDQTVGSLIDGNDGTRFIQEELTIDNTLYFHMVVGDPALGFSNESYTRASLTSVGPNRGQSTAPNYMINPFSPDSGGNEISVGATAAQSQNAVQRKGLGDKTTLFGNGRDPFGVGSLTAPVSAADSARITGSGTGDPTRTVMRMTLSDSQMVQEVNKPLLDRKPLISQVTTDNATMTSEFQADLRGLTYTQKDRNTPVVNRLTLNLTGVDALPTDGAADFDMTKVQRSTVTAGKFAYTAGSGWNSADGWSHQVVDPNTGNLVQDAVFSAGTYTGEGNGFDPLGVNWAQFFNPSQNPGCTNGGKRQIKGICPQ